MGVPSTSLDHAAVIRPAPHSTPAYVPATADAPAPIALNQAIAARSTMHRTGPTAAGPMPTSCFSRAVATTAGPAVGNGAPQSPTADGWAGPTAPAHLKSTTPITPRSFSGATSTRPDRTTVGDGEQLARIDTAAQMVRTAGAFAGDERLSGLAARKGPKAAVEHLEMPNRAAGDLARIDQRQLHCRLREFVRRGGVDEFAGIVSQPRGKDRF